MKRQRSCAGTLPRPRETLGAPAAFIPLSLYLRENHFPLRLAKWQRKEFIVLIKEVVSKVFQQGVEPEVDIVVENVIGTVVIDPMCAFCCAHGAFFLGDEVLQSSNISQVLQSRTEIVQGFPLGYQSSLFV